MYRTLSLEESGGNMEEAHGDGTGRDIGEPKVHGSGSGNNRSWLGILNGRIRFRSHNALKWLLVGAASLLALFAVTDVMKNRRIRAEIMWDQRYTRAVVSDFQSWHVGWRLEDLAQQSADQRSRISALMDALEKVPPQADDGRTLKAAWGGTGAERSGDLGRKVSRGVVLAKVLAEEEDLNRLVSVQCDTRPGIYLQVGVNGMMAATDDACKLVSAAKGRLGPHSIFEKMDLGEGQFALRAFSTGRYLRVNPPARDDYGHVWFLEIGSPVIGIPEVFRMRDGMVYSDVMRGYLSCSGGGATAEVKGFVGETLWQHPNNYIFSFQKVPDHVVERGRRLRDLYRQVHAAQSRVVDEYIKKQATSPVVPVQDKMETIALCVPMTSRGTFMNSTSHSPLWEHAFRTFMATTNWKANRFRYRWYLGFDAGDPIYDSPRARESLQRDFFTVAMQEFAVQGVEMPADSTKHSFEDVLSLKPMTFNDHENAPSRVVSDLMQEAYDDGCDYLYQLNDDTIIETHGWAETLTGVLRNNPRGRNVGVTGPTDLNNPRIFTHAFAHRTHLEIFGRFFPYSFMNWWSDDWISNVYGKDNTFRDHRVSVTHDVRSQKTDQNNRYRIDYLAEDRLLGELQTGYVKLSKWLRAHHMPPPILPEVCGYAPLIETIDYKLMSQWEAGVPIPPPSPQHEGENRQRSAEGAGGLVSGEVKPRKRTAVVTRGDEESAAAEKRKTTPLRPQRGVEGGGDNGAGPKSTLKQKGANPKEGAGEFNVDDFIQEAFKEPAPIATTPKKSYIRPKGRGRRGVKIPPSNKRKHGADEGKVEGVLEGKVEGSGGKTLDGGQHGGDGPSAM